MPATPANSIKAHFWRRNPCRGCIVIEGLPKSRLFLKGGLDWTVSEGETTYLGPDLIAALAGLQMHYLTHAGVRW